MFGCSLLFLASITYQLTGNGISQTTKYSNCSPGKYCVFMQQNIITLNLRTRNEFVVLVSVVGIAKSYVKLAPQYSVVTSTPVYLEISINAARD